jgi:hypothetical protein
MIVALCGLFAFTATARAAEVVEVRVGRHPDFTRVVFELDRAAGYRIERSDPSSKNAELIVSLDAGSIPRRIQSSKSFIEQVVVEPSGSRSIARIRLAKGGLKLKEMILASPPRIVLDVISESGIVTAATTKPTTASKPAPTIAAKTTPTPAVKPAPSTPSPATKTLAANDSAGNGATAKPVAPVPAMPTPKTKVLATTEQPGASGTPPPSAPLDATANARGTAGSATETVLAQNDGATAPSEWNDGAIAGGAEAAASAAATAAANAEAIVPPSAADAAARPHERPMMVKSTDRDGEGSGLMTWALVGAGVVALGFGGLVVARRRRMGAMGDLDEVDRADDDEAATSPFSDTETGEEVDEEEDEDKPQTADTSNPFAGIAGGAFGSSPSRESAKSTRPMDRPTDGPKNQPKNQEKKPSESLLFDDAEETKMENMEVISRSQTSELGGAMPMMGAGSDEITQMFREMQRRVAALESRIDELVDARDRLERQVAAQTEELRVQRAAIARTQRAVRNLSTRDDAGEDEPTEPALREPN